LRGGVGEEAGGTGRVAEVVGLQVGGREAGGAEGEVTAEGAAGRALGGHCSAVFEVASHGGAPGVGHAEGSEVGVGVAAEADQSRCIAG
jgi:hypothetical protein